MPLTNILRFSHREEPMRLSHNGFETIPFDLSMKATNKVWTRSVTGALAVLILSLSVTAQQPANTRGYPPPGKLVDVGGWRIHLNCTGRNKAKTPTIVLESGSGDFSFDWSLVQPDVA